MAERDTRDPLDDYVEAHVHGVVDLCRDVEALVLDPSYRGSTVETTASRIGCSRRTTRDSSSARLRKASRSS